jgi:hypothetical protein
MKTAAHFSPDGRCRFWLRRTWSDPEAPRPLWIGHNPSGAYELHDGPTRRRIIEFCKLWKQPGCDLGNLYPFKSPDPAVCRRIAASTKAQLQENLDHLARLSAQASMIVACFGNIARDQAWVDHVFEQIASVRPGMPVYCLGTTKDGAPKHPMARGQHRVPNDQQPVLWRTL